MASKLVNADVSLLVSLETRRKPHVLVPDLPDIHLAQNYFLKIKGQYIGTEMLAFGCVVKKKLRCFKTKHICGNGHKIVVSVHVFSSINKFGAPDSRLTN
jgi:hypothetical protein